MMYKCEICHLFQSCSLFCLFLTKPPNLEFRLLLIFQPYILPFAFLKDIPNWHAVPFKALNVFFAFTQHNSILPKLLDSFAKESVVVAFVAAFDE